MSSYAKLILKTKSRMTDQLYTYKVPDDIDLSKGQRVLVPFGRGNNKVVGIVVDFINQEDIDRSINYKEIEREIESLPILNEELIEIAFFMSDKYLSDLSSSINTVLPPGDIVNITELFKSKNANDPISNFLRLPKTYEEIKEEFPHLTRKDLKSLLDDKKIESKIVLSRGASIKKERFVKLIDGNESKISNSAYKQKEILDYLKESKEKTISQKELLQKTKSSLSSLKSLEKKKLIEIYDQEVFREVLDDNLKAYDKHCLNDEQNRVFKEISTADSKVFLLKGVTGSGKTEIYLHLVEKAIKEGKEAIVLVPEISLTPQTIERFSGRFGNRVAVLHSKLSASERFDQWRMIRDGYYDIVVGTRSAIFAPFNNIGIIIIDEEHELSYINEQNPKYDAIEVAQFRSDYHSCNLLLGSATPKIESYYKAEKREYKLLELKNRVSNKKLPLVYKVDMREELKSGNFSMFSEDLHQAIDDALQDGKQSILFLNKRGHTSYVFCRKCGYVQRCDFCDASMTFHKSKNISICHLCGRTGKKPLICPSCGSNAIKEFGAGTQKLEEATKEEFPKARVARMDADTMSKKDSYDRIYYAMDDNKIDILIGTQMISKGFDFKDVDVVGIIAADLSLNIPDFRASEKTFQLITQVAGRSGRGENQGKVFIQTYQPDHYAIAASENHDYESFYKDEIEFRKHYEYPPFYDMVLIRCSHLNRNQAFNRAVKIASDISREVKTKDFKIIGPNPSVVGRINNRFRFNIIIKTIDSIEEIKKVIDEKVLKNPDLSGQGFRYYVMINPNSF